MANVFDADQVAGDLSDFETEAKSENSSQSDNSNSSDNYASLDDSAARAR